MNKKKIAGIIASVIAVCGAAIGLIAVAGEVIGFRYKEVSVTGEDGTSRKVIKKRW